MWRPQCNSLCLVVDIWSVGCIMAEMVLHKVLFPGRDCILPRESAQIPQWLHGNRAGRGHIGVTDTSSPGSLGFSNCQGRNLCHPSCRDWGWGFIPPVPSLSVSTSGIYICAL